MTEAEPVEQTTSPSVPNDLLDFASGVSPKDEIQEASISGFDFVGGAPEMEMMKDSPKPTPVSVLETSPPSAIPMFDFTSNVPSNETTAVNENFLKFRVLGKDTAEIQEGTEIDYKLSLYGVPMGWKTRILGWIPYKSFVDTQLKGPYSLWHHTHTFEKLGDDSAIISLTRPSR